MKVAKGFKVELLYSVPKDEQGSWVNMCVDPKGRLIVSDQYGALYRVTPPPIGGKAEDTKIEKIPAKIGMAQGLLWAFDCPLRRGQRRRDRAACTASRRPKKDDTLDTVELLRARSRAAAASTARTRSSPHPDGKRLTVVCGNQTKMIEVRHDARAAASGAKTTCCRGCRTATAS